MARAGFSVVVTGSGKTLTFNGANTYTGGTTIIFFGTLSLGNSAGAGTGAITFAANAGATLAIESGVDVAECDLRLRRRRHG